MAKKDKGKSSVTVFPAWCKGCGICVEFCPSNVLELSDEGKSTVVREDDCIRCGFCELHCPDFAIVVKEKEPGAAKKAAADKDAKTAKGAK